LHYFGFAAISFLVFYSLAVRVACNASSSTPVCHLRRMYKLSFSYISFHYALLDYCIVYNISTAYYTTSRESGSIIVARELGPAVTPSDMDNKR
jgi:hypothetical protein